VTGAGFPFEGRARGAETLPRHEEEVGAGERRLRLGTCEAEWSRGGWRLGATALPVGLSGQRQGGGSGNGFSRDGPAQKIKRKGEKGKEVSRSAGSPVGWRGCLGQRAELEGEREERISSFSKLLFQNPILKNDF
jgi:hypothetical protein